MNGLFGHLGLTQEQTFGGEASSPAAYVKITDESIRMDSNLLKQDVVAGTRFPTLITPGKISASGDIGFFLEPEGALPWILKGLFGNAASGEVVSGVYDHVFEPVETSTLPSFSIQVNAGAACIDWLGCTVSNVTMAVDPAGPIRMNAGVISQRPKESAEYASPSYSQVPQWNSRDAAFTLNGESNLKFEIFLLISITISNRCLRSTGIAGVTGIMRNCSRSKGL